MRRSSTIILIVGQIVLSCVPIAAFGATASFDKAMQEYKVRDYDKAAADLSMLVHQQPENANAHYMLGCCLTQLNQLENAIAEYNSAVRCDKTGQVRTLATQAMDMLVGYRKIAVQDEPAEKAANSLAVIRAQAASATQEEKLRRAKWIDDQEQSSLGGTIRKQGPNAGGRFDPTSLQNALQTDKDYWEKSRQRMASDGFGNAELNESARGLAIQMQSNNGSVRLVPGLTNLYTRTYSFSQSSPSNSHKDAQTKLPEQLAADQNRLILQPVNSKLVSHVAPAPLAAGQDKLILHNKDDKSQRELDVFGRITHK